MKSDNNRKYPGEHGPRPDHNEWKRKQALEQQATWRKLTPTQQLAELDKRLGRGEGAQKQRTRILSRMTPVEAFAATEEPTNTGPKKPKAKDRRAAEQAASKSK